MTAPTRAALAVLSRALTLDVIDIRSKCHDGDFLWCVTERIERAAAALLREPSEYDCAPVADTVNSWCREAHVEETPSAKWSDVRAAVYRLWDKLGSQRLQPPCSCGVDAALGSKLVSDLYAAADALKRADMDTVRLDKAERLLAHGNDIIGCDNTVPPGCAIEDGKPPLTWHSTLRSALDAYEEGR